MTFSVIVPFLNEGKYIKDCARSLLAQDFPEAERELIFIDNDSSDGSSSFVRQFSEIQLLNEHNHNVYVARNRGLQMARGEIIAFTDADCVVSGDWLSQFRKAMEDPGVLIALGAVYFRPGCSAAAKLFEEFQREISRHIFTNRISEKYYGYTNNMAVRASVFKELGKFSEHPVTGDTEMVQRCARHYGAASVAYFDNAKVWHMEVKAAVTCLKKLFFYGNYNTATKRKNVTIREFFTIYLACCRKNAYSFWKAAYLFLLMILGNAASFAGMITARIASGKAAAGNKRARI
ncbi:MAG: glycosyltransferase [Candidatus Omnitrophota bacterium]